MNHDKTFAAIGKLQEVEIELHRLKNALEMANKAFDAQPKRTWVGLTSEEIWDVLQFRGYNTDTIEIAKTIEAKLKEKNT